MLRQPAARIATIRSHTSAAAGAVAGDRDRARF